MSKRTTSFAEGESYHIYNRGTDRRTIFLDQADYERFVELLYLANSSQSFAIRKVFKTDKTIYPSEKRDLLVAIGAYCLMPNHFHLLISPVVEGGLTKFMRKLGTGYTMYFNRKYKRTGSLFQGSFKGEHASTDKYLKYLYAYIHLNPVKLIDSDWVTAGIKDKEKAFAYASNYRYSSLGDYLEKERGEREVLNQEFFPKYFENANAHKKELFEWLGYGEKE